MAYIARANETTEVVTERDEMDGMLNVSSEVALGVAAESVRVVDEEDKDDSEDRTGYKLVSPAVVSVLCRADKLVSIRACGIFGENTSATDCATNAIGICCSTSRTGRHSNCGTSCGTSSGTICGTTCGTTFDICSGGFCSSGPNS